MRESRLYKHVPSTGLQGLHKCAAGLEGDKSHVIEKTEYNLIRAAITLKNDPEGGLLPMEHVCDYVEQLRSNVDTTPEVDENAESTDS